METNKHGSVLLLPSLFVDSSENYCDPNVKSSDHDHTNNAIQSLTIEYEVSIGTIF